MPDAPAPSAPTSTPPPITPPAAPAAPAAPSIEGTPPPSGEPTKPPRPSIDDDLAGVMDKSDDPLPADKKDESQGDKPPEPSKDDPQEKLDPDYDGLETSKPPEAPPEPNEKNPKELRDAYHRVKGRVKDLEKELAEAKSGPVKDDERKTLTEQVSQLQQKLNEANQVLQMAAFEQTDEYKEKFEKPFIDAWSSGVEQVKMLDITDDKGNTRKGVPEDFEFIMREVDDQRAANLAAEMFGPNSFYVLAARRDIQRIHKSRTEALNQHRGSFADRLKSEREAMEKTQQEQEQNRTQAAEAFRSTIKAGVEKFPQYFSPVEGDAKGNELLQKGFERADLVFFGDDKLSREERIALHASIRNKAGAFNRLAYQTKQKDERIKELEKELAEFRGSIPGAGAVGKADSTPRRLTADEEFDAIASRRS